MRRPEQGCSPEEVEDEVLDAERWEAFGERSEEHGIVPVTAVAAACALVAGAWDGDPTRRSVADRAHLLPAGERSGGALLTGGPTRVRVSFAVLGTDPALTLRWSAEESTGTEESAGTEEGSAAKEAEEDTEAGEGGEAARAGRALPGHTAGLHAATRRLLSLLATDDAAWSRTDLGWIPGFDPILPNEPPARCGPLDGPVRQAMAARPEAPALHTADRTVRFGELASLVDALRARLDERGTGPGDVVAVALDKSPEQIAAVLAVVGAGAAYVPIGADWPAERVSQVIEQSGAQTLLTTTDLVEQGRVRPSVGLLTVDTTPPAPPAGQGGPAEDTAGPDDLAYVIYTSGSTGTPKGVAVEHTAARNTVDDITERFGVGPDDSVLGLSALSFDLSVYDIFGVLGAGGRIVLPDPSAQHDPAHWRELAATHRVTVWNTAPALLEMLVDHSEGDPEQARADLSSLRLVLLSGDWIPVTLPDRLRALAPGARVISLGGATEASIWSIHHPIGEVDPAWRSVPYGVPLRDQWFHILDEELRPVAVGAVGELFIGGAGLAREYLGDPERTAERFLVHPVTGHRLYRTGDLGRWHPDGTIEFLGRNDRQVKLRGHRIELAEIEARLACHPRVRQSAVKVLRAGQGDRLIAYAVLHGPLSDAEQVLHEHLAALLPAYMLPSRIVRLGRLPTTANGKIDYAALPDPHTDPEAPDTPADAHRVPTTPAEKALAGIWSEILGIDDIGLDEDFFGLGGDSLLAARMAGAVKARLGVALPVSGVYDGCTLEQFARMMTDRDDHRPAAPEALAADPDERSFPLTDLQQAYWIGQQDLYRLSYHSAHFSLDFEAEGLDPAALQRAVDRIVAHQPMLRARLLDDGRQEILNPEQVPAYPLRVRDLRGLGAAEQDATVEHTREELARSGPRPESWPLFDLRVDLLTERVSRLYLCCSLLIADGWSFNLFFEELFAVHGDPDARLERLRVTFRDYVLARERLRAGDDYRRHREYWLRRLDTLPPAPRLPLVDAPERSRTDLMTRRVGGLGPASWQTFRARCAERGLTTSMALAAAYAEVIARRTPESRFTLNVLYFNRLPLHPDFGRTLGPFATTTLLETDGSAASDLTTRALRLRRDLGRAVAHDLFSGVDAIRELTRRQGATDVPLMPVVFTSTIGFSSWYRRPQTEQITVRDVYERVRTPQVHLDLQVYEQDGELRYNLDATEELFVPGTIDTLASDLQELVCQLAAGDGAWERAIGTDRRADGTDDATLVLRHPMAAVAPGADTHQAPDGPVEEALCALWQQVLGVDRISVTADFFRAGGDSLLVIRLLTAVAREFGRHLRPAAFLAAPTVRGLAALLDGAPASGGAGGTAEDGAITVLIRPGADSRPLFLLHPSGGDVLCYARLARLTGDRPVVGVQDPASPDRRAPADGAATVPQMAARYLRAIRAWQPHGPYALAGWSLGGVLAQEIACGLQEAGERVSLLALIDANAPDAIAARGWLDEPGDAYPMLRLARSLEARHGLPLLAETDQELTALPGPDRAERVADRLSAAGLLPRDGALHELTFRTRVFERHLRALLAHRPRAFHGDALLLRAAEPAPRNSRTGIGVDDAREAELLGWRPHITGAVREVTVPGHHYDLIEEPGAAVIARAIQRQIQQESRPGGHGGLRRGGTR